ncbi:hypothetical protein H5410_009585 [Solanum commersonii]|uniref:Uncharacterized protein n=1 Tax=Solanum commersonii TaxID=4109 RepID=A0A9J6AK19_SOLCO|nr:hypothetical protein H5410_009585 [Solanum commersonii]
MNQANLAEHCPNPSIDEENEGKKIGIGTKTDSYSISKIWLWSKRGKFASSSDCQMEDQPPSGWGRVLAYLDLHIVFFFGLGNELSIFCSDWKMA